MKQSITRLARHEPFGIQVAKGEIPGHTVEHKFGANPDISTALETIWPEGGVYVYRATAIKMKISSSSTDDDVGGSGALTVTIYGLDANYALINETIILTGQTEVNTTNLYLRVFRMIVNSAGAGGKNAGIVYAGTGVVGTGKPAVVHALISVGENQSEVAFYTVPAATTALIESVYVGIDLVGANKSIRTSLLVRPFGEVFQLKFSLQSASGDAQHTFTMPIKVAAKADIELQAITSASGVVRGGFEMTLIDD